jgi:hypothetical protein
MRRISVIESADVNTGPEKAWEIIGPDFVNIAVWGPGINKSWENDSIESTIPDAPAGGRYCDLGNQGVFDERIIHYDKDKYEITWSATGEKLPGFVRGLQNALRIVKTGEDTCRITSNISANAEGVMGFFMAGVIQKSFAKTVPGFLSSWKLYAETKTLSANKEKELSAL